MRVGVEAILAPRQEGAGKPTAAAIRKDCDRIATEPADSMEFESRRAC
jgi:hypothetical protein